MIDSPAPRLTDRAAQASRARRPAQTTFTLRDRPRRVARLAALAAFALGLVLLSLGCSVPVQTAGAGQLAETPAVAAVEEASAVGVVLAPLEMAVSIPGEPVDSAQDGTVEANAPADVDPELLSLHPSPSSRSGRLASEALEVPLESVTASEKVANVQALTAAKLAVPSVRARLDVEVQVAKTPTPKPVVRKAVAPKVTSSTTQSPTGSWVELPNVRPIPSGSYAAVHQWDPMVNYWSNYYHVDPDLIRRIIYTESRGYQYAYVASTGVKGLMQITPSWFKAGENPYDPWTNIGKGAYILRRGYDAYHTWFKAVSFYCYGPLGRYSSIPTFYASLIFSPIDYNR